MPTDPVTIVGLIIAAMFAFVAIVSLLFAVFIRSQKKTLELKENHLRAMTDSERKYRYLFENSVVGMARINVTTPSVLEMNNSLATSLSVKNSVELDQLFFATPNPISHVVFGMRVKDRIEDVECEFKSLSGTPIWFSVSAYMNRSEDYCTLVFTDVTARKNAAELTKTLAQRVVHAEEMERGRVAREIHDGVTQSLLVINRLLSSGLPSNRRTGKPLLKSVTSAGKMVETAIQDLRRISQDLRPSIVEDLGLVPAIKGLIVELKSRTRLQIDSEFRSVPAELPFQTEITLYRFFQEAFSNIEKHARAKRVTTRLIGEDSVILAEISDDGKGITRKLRRSRSISSSGSGLRGLQERVELLGGSLDISSRPKSGTLLRLTLTLSFQVEMPSETH